MRLLLVASVLFALVVAPVGNEPSDDEDVPVVRTDEPPASFPLVVGNPWHWNGAGFYFAPDRLNAAVLACKYEKEDPIYLAHCPLNDFKQMAEVFKTVKKVDALDLKESSLLRFGQNCLEAPERRFTETFRQPDGVLYVAVTPTEACRGFALEWTFFAFYVALDRAMPRFGLSFDKAPTYSKEYLESLQDEALAEDVAQPEKPIPELAELEVDGFDLAITNDFMAALKKNYFDATGQDPPAQGLAEGKAELEGKSQEAFLAISSTSSHPFSKARAMLERKARHHHRLADREDVPFSKHDVPNSVLNSRIVKYKWAAGVPSAVKIKIVNAQHKWEAKTCVIWRKAKALDVSPAIMTFDSNNDDEDYVNDRMSMISRQSDSTVVEHELGHVLGLGHTQQRNDRDNYIKWKGGIPNPDSQHETRQMSINRNAGFARYFDVDQPGVWDWDSVMLYGSYGPHDDYVEKKWADYTAFEQWLFNMAWGGYPPSVGTRGFTGATYGGPTASDMDAHVVNLKYKCYAKNPNTGARWNLGANSKHYTSCPPTFTRRVVRDGAGASRPLCVPPG